jgi:two-component system, OmpR family, response regulator RegX3
MTATLLLIGNDKASLKTYASFFNKKDYSVVIATSGRQALSQSKSHNLEAVILDTTAPRLNCRALAKKIRGETSAPIVLIALPNARPDSAIAHAGIVTKPVNAKKILSRVKTAIDEKPPKLLERGNLTLDLEKHRLARGNKSFKLTPKEFVLIKLFMARAGQTISRKVLMKEVWDTDYLGDTRTLDVHIRGVREKVEDSPSKPQRLITVRGQGYKLQVEK